MKKIMSLLSIALLVVSCASNDKKDEKNPFDALTLKEVLQEGKTSQAEIAKAFGAPDILTEDSSKNDVWIYSKHKDESDRSRYGVGGAALLPGMWSLVGGALSSGKSESSSKTTTLTLEFDRKKTLKSYQLMKVRI